MSDIMSEYSQEIQSYVSHYVILEKEMTHLFDPNNNNREMVNRLVNRFKGLQKKFEQFKLSGQIDNVIEALYCFTKARMEILIDYTCLLETDFILSHVPGYKTVLLHTSTGIHSRRIEQELKKSLELLEMPQTWLLLGSYYQQNRNVNKALECFKKIENDDKFGEIAQECILDLNKLELELEGEKTAVKCFIATAVYGSYNESNVVTLRYFRDKYLSTTKFGRFIIDNYYRYSPSLAKVVEHNEALKFVIRHFLLNLFVCIISLITQIAKE